MEIKVAVVEDSKALRESIATLFMMNEGFKLVGSYSNANSIIKDIQTSKPDVVLMDIQMPGTNGIEAVKLLRAEFPELKIVIQTVFEDDDSIFQAICNGASGYILKRSTPNEYTQAIIEAYNGGAPITGSIAAKVLNMFKHSQQSNPTTDFNLSDREKEVLNHLVKGLSYKMIADKCGISYDTVRFHMKNIYSKLHVESMTEAVSMAIKNKIV
ncbi:MAG: response regulator transcription factor [Bacteroidota bacterium]|nr:response regulator transcription factor [Bacteroidota bacterium]